MPISADVVVNIKIVFIIASVVHAISSQIFIDYFSWRKKPRIVAYQILVCIKRFFAICRMQKKEPGRGGATVFCCRIGDGSDVFFDSVRAGCLFGNCDKNTIFPGRYLAMQVFEFSFAEFIV